MSEISRWSLPRLNERNGTAQQERDNWSKEGSILGGSLRGIVGLLIKTFKFKGVFYKKAFLNIADQAVGEERSINRPPRRLAHSKLVVYTQSMLMGVVVFATYDGIVHGWRKYQYGRKASNDEDVIEDHGPMDGVSILVHGVAGAASGITRSMFWVGWERCVYAIPHSLAFSWRTTVHHATGHGILFGGYFGLRTLLLECMGSPNTAGSYRDDAYPLLATFLAGGWAGQIHHVAQHYTSHWRQFRLHQFPKPPRIGPTMTAFIPMAMCFLAFEHGAEGIDELLKNLDLDS